MKAGTVRNNSYQQPGLFMECFHVCSLLRLTYSRYAHSAKNQMERRQRHPLNLGPRKGVFRHVEEQRLTENCYSVKTPHEGKQLCTFLRAGQPHL